MIKFDIKPAAQKAGITSSYQLQNATGWHPQMAVRLWNKDVRRIDLETLEALCEVLDCRPQDLLIYEPNKKKARTNGKK